MQDVLSWVASTTCAALERRPAGGAEAIVEVLATDHGLVRDEEGRWQPPELPIRTGRVVDLADRLGLDVTDAALLSVVLAPDLDATIGRAYDLLGGATHGAVTTAVALELCAVPTAGPEAVERLGEAAPLRAHQLLSVDGDAAFLRRALRCPERVLAHLAGSDRVPPAIAAMASAVRALPSDQAGEASAALLAGVGLVWVHSPPGTAGASVGAEAFQRLPADWMALDLRHRPPGLDPRTALEAALLEATLVGAGLVLEGAEALAEGGGLGPLLRSTVPTVAVSRERWRHDWAPALAQPLLLDAPALTPAERMQVWAAEVPSLADEPASSADLAALGALRLTPTDVAGVARYAAQLAAARGVTPTAALLREATRTLSAAANAGVGAVARAAGAATFADLVLPPRESAELQRLVGWAQHRDEVLQRGAVHGKAGRSPGISALFTGSPGTGKTLAAHIVADAIGVDLFQVDLSGVIDKYIGETEKNLERIFHHAESRNLLLFFDEADALFGNRSDVKDAHDRYANQEIAYLLQRMEHYDGITVLATNLRGNLDPAFTRRLQFIVTFPNPDEETRLRLWERHLQEAGELDEDDAVDLELLSSGLELAGGDIRNIVLTATYDAVCADEPLGMRHLHAATARELTKLGRRLPPAFAGASPVR